MMFAVCLLSHRYGYTPDLPGLCLLDTCRLEGLEDRRRDVGCVDMAGYRITDQIDELVVLVDIQSPMRGEALYSRRLETRPVALSFSITLMLPSGIVSRLMSAADPG